MEKDFNKEMLEHSKEYAEAMEKRILEGKVIADVIYKVDNSRILVTMTSTGRYGYVVYEEYRDEPVYFVEGDYLIEDLQKTTDYEGNALMYPGAKSMIEKNMVGMFSEYRKYPEFHDFYISVKAPKDSPIQVTQQMAGYSSQYPVTILGANFIANEFYYGALAQLYIDPKTGKQTIRIGTGFFTPEGLPDIEHSIKMEMEAQAYNPFFGQRPKRRYEVEEIIKKHTMQAQALLTPLYQALGLPMYEGVEYSPLLMEGLKGEQVDKYIGEDGSLLPGGQQK
jgi:hypothetical protein